MNALEMQSFFKRDSASLGSSDKPEIANEENSILIDMFSLRPLQFAGKQCRKRETQVDSQGSRTHNATIVELNLIRLVRRSNLPFSLQPCDDINERWILPGFKSSQGMLGGDNVGCRLLNYAKTIQFQQANDRGFPSARRPGDDESLHMFLKQAADDMRTPTQDDPTQS